ncbi:hypothetical protein INR49_026267 [Caranx melampygus]|nr:hypothetical protein INR49_026267 [Caranx melampygus]
MMNCRHSGSVAAANPLPSYFLNADLQEATPPAPPAAATPAAATPTTAKQDPSADLLNGKTQEGGGERKGERKRRMKEDRRHREGREKRCSHGGRGGKRGESLSEQSGTCLLLA